MKRNSYIVLETLNPQSLIIFSASYYKDLSHIQPIHPATLLFLCKSIGFQGCEVKYSAPIAEKDLLQTLPDTEENKLQNENISKLNNLLFGSQNYAIIGKKI
jgi:O-antigen chain-terminating methyltransferase